MSQSLIALHNDTLLSIQTKIQLPLTNCWVDNVKGSSDKAWIAIERVQLIDMTITLQLNAVKGQDH